MAENSEQAQLPILIIGAGICGLALAHGLHNNNIPYIVLEKDSSLASPPRGATTTRDWAIACHWAVPTLASLLGPRKWSRNASADIDPAAAGAGRPLGPIPVLNGRTGALENRIPSSAGFRRFVRSRLRALIAGDDDGDDDDAAAEKLDVRYGRRLERISYGVGTVTAHLADGSSATGRLLVGADGSQSAVRRLLLSSSSGAAELKRLPFGATFVNASFARERALWLRSFHPAINLVVHPGDMVGMLGVLDAADPGAPESWRFSFYVSWGLGPEELARDEEICGGGGGGGGSRGRESGEEERGGGRGGEEEEEEEEGRKRRERRAARLRAAKEKSRLFAEPLRSCFEWLADDHEEVYYSRVANWDPSLEGHRWDNRGGLVTLVGDAAHPMTYQRGQGLNHALADAGKLVELLAGRGDGQQQQQADLIRAYEEEMRARAGEEVRQSELNTIMLHDWARVLQSPLLQRGLKFGSGEDKVEDKENGGKEGEVPAPPPPAPVDSAEEGA